MRRLIIDELLRWKNQLDRCPLLVRGARQVGKSYIIEVFGHEHFENLVTINFELMPEFKQAFRTLLPDDICNALMIKTKQDIIPGKTLLFLDEIQECPAAIQSLRYFKEKYPELHVIAAGSLLEFILNQEDFRMPVGRVQSYFLKPLSFKEFLLATDNNKIIDLLNKATLQNGIDNFIHEHILSVLKQYFILGGMPAVIQKYLHTKNYGDCQEVQANLLTTYRNDFGKYANKAKHKYLEKVFSKAPGMVATHLKYVDIDPTMQSRDLKEAIQILSDAGLLYQVFSCKANGLPLNVQLNEKKYKLLFLDVGLVQYVSQLSADILFEDDLLLLNRGQIAEQFVGQELLTLSKIYQPGEIYYWEAAKRGQISEVDYVISIDSKIVPIEVKAGITGTLKSLKKFIEEKNCKYGVRISQRPLSVNNNILSIPLYMIDQLPRIYNEMLQMLG